MPEQHGLAQRMQELQARLQKLGVTGFERVAAQGEILENAEGGAVAPEVAFEAYQGLIATSHSLVTGELARLRGVIAGLAAGDGARAPLQRLEAIFSEQLTALSELARYLDTGEAPLLASAEERMTRAAADARALQAEQRR